ncbi:MULTISPECIES: MaoC family dehydratase [Micrococcaceae]|uniref:MaoC family dehydratase n=1 Tax=unclassified Kocuria TaxID=2649579 RepID=UPI0010107D57|nr:MULTISPECIES: MaoC family dehydratase [unclassified Kocuria]
MAIVNTTLAELKDLVGKELGPCKAQRITQEQVNTFADATGDHQYIHVDPERAKNGPYGTTIAHGFLTLSLTLPMFAEILDVTDVSTKINYGLEKVRFPSPVKVGDRVCMTSILAEVKDIEGGVQVEIDNAVTSEGASKPAVVARSVLRFYS